MPEIWKFAPIFLAGIWGTLKIAFVCLAISLPVGLIVGAGRYSRRRIFAWPARTYVEVFRNTPILVMIMWFFFAFPIIAPFEVDAFTAAVLALSLNTSAFFAEIFRTGIQSMAPGQWDAARAIGMSYGQQLRRVVLPQAVRRMIPAFTNRWIELIKLTSLAATIAYTEILHTARLVASAYYNPVEMFTAAALIYFAIIYPMVRLTYWLETRMRRSGV